MAEELTKEKEKMAGELAKKMAEEKQKIAEEFAQKKEKLRNWEAELLAREKSLTEKGTIGADDGKNKFFVLCSLLNSLLIIILW